MKCTIPEISWHNRDPILSVDIQHNTPDGIYRMVTAGTDHHVVIWQLRILDNGGVSVESLSDLAIHNKAVNAVRFSPDGTMLASADDESSLIIWKKSDLDGTGADLFGEDGGKENREHWSVFKMLRGHLEDIYDICWSSCSSFLISGSVDNSAILWDVAKGKNIGLLNEHKGFVQGVAWDPKGQYVATMCTDRCLRMFQISNKKVICKVHKAPFPRESTPVTADAVNEKEEKSTKLFYDDTLKSFCRRLTFSPDGEILVVPTGLIENPKGGSKHINGSHVFSRYAPQKPVLFLPTNEKYTLAARFCPLLFELNSMPLMQKSSSQNTEDENCEENLDQNLFHLPYRMIFAVATQNHVVLYDTQQSIPFAKIANIHYTRLSDISWSEDGLILVVSSTDGYCSLVSFTEGELGKPYLAKSGSLPEADIIKSKNEQTELKSNSKPKSTTTLEKMEVDEKPKLNTISTPKPIAVRRSGENKSGKRVALVTLPKTSQKVEDVATKMEVSDAVAKDTVTENELNNTEANDSKMDIEPPSNNKSPFKSPIKSGAKTPRRINLVTISSPKDKKANKDGR